jgi:hypothetical protein
MRQGSIIAITISVAGLAAGIASADQGQLQKLYTNKAFGYQLQLPANASRAKYDRVEANLSFVYFDLPLTTPRPLSSKQFQIRVRKITEVPAPTCAWAIKEELKKTQKIYPWTKITLGEHKFLTMARTSDSNPESIEWMAHYNLVKNDLCYEFGVSLRGAKFMREINIGPIDPPEFDHATEIDIIEQMLTTLEFRTEVAGKR